MKPQLRQPLHDDEAQHRDAREPAPRSPATGLGWRSGRTTSVNLHENSDIKPFRWASPVFIQQMVRILEGDGVRAVSSLSAGLMAVAPGRLTGATRRCSAIGPRSGLDRGLRPLRVESRPSRRRKKRNTGSAFSTGRFGSPEGAGRCGVRLLRQVGTGDAGAPEPGQCL